MPCLASSTAGGAKPLVIAIKRVVLDARVARAAAVEAGAELVEDAPVARADFSPADGLWTIHCQTRPARRYTARALVIADGALSRLARALGLVTTPPDAVCSRSYIAPGTSEFAADGVLFYPASLLPGYCSVFREADGSFSFCCYVIPGGSTRLTDLKARHHELLGSDPQLARPWDRRPVSSRCARRRSASAACPGARATTSCVVGDAAGQIDPLTGEGIQYAMDAAEIAAGDARRGLRGRRPRRAVPPAVPPALDGRLRPGFPLVPAMAPGLRPVPRPAGCLGRDDAPPRLRVLHGVGRGHDGLKPKRALVGPASSPRCCARWPASGGRGAPDGATTARGPGAARGLDVRRVLSASVRVT